MESVSALRAVLTSTLIGGGDQDADQELFDELTVNKPLLMKVFDFGPRSAEEQREIDSGMCLHHSS